MSEPTHDTSDPIVHLQFALARLDNDMDLLRDLAGFYVEDAPQLCMDLKSALDTEDVDQVIRSAHSLKGLSSNFDALRATELSLEIEMAGRENDLELARNRFPVVKHEVARVVDYLKRQVLHRSS